MHAPGQTQTAGTIVVGNSSGVATEATPTGAMTMTSAGVFSGATTGFQYATVNVSSAELLAINATPKTIVAAPGAGFIVLVHKAVAILDFGSAYSSNGLLGLYETNASGQLITGTLTLASFLGAGADVIKELVPNVSTTTGITRLDNKAIVLTQATGESTGGTSVVRVHVWYSVHAHGL